MEPNRSVEHNYNTEGMKLGDWFLGCNKCWFQLPVGAAAVNECPICLMPLSVLTINKGDL